MPLQKRRWPSWVACLVMACGMATGAPALAQGVQPDSLTVQFDNDEFAGINRRDRWYSQAVRVHHFAPATAAGWAAQAGARWCELQVCASEAQFTRRWSLGQNAYTQNERRLASPDPQDRPTAGWLYGSAAVLVEAPDETRMIELQLGVIGPAAGAELVQNQWHRLLRVDEVLGWSSQLRPRLGLQMVLLQENRLALLGSRVDLVRRLSVSVGTVSAQTGVALVLRAGDHLSGTATAAEAQTATGRVGSGGRWSVQAGVALRAVAYDRLIEGPVYGYVSQVRREPLVGEMQIGATLAPWPDWSFRFALIRRSMDFDSPAVRQGRYKPQTFGVFQAAVVLR